MLSRQSDNSPLKINPIVNNKLEHLTCTNCKHAFSLRGAHHFRGKIPLLLECGHALCEMCAKTSQNKTCGSCGVVYRQQNPKEQATFLVNVYVLGLINASQSIAINSTEPNIDFQQPATARLRKSVTEDLGHPEYLLMQHLAMKLQSPYSSQITSYSTEIIPQNLKRYFRICESRNYYFVQNVCVKIEYCSECGLKADFRCRQCEVFFCNLCYAKIHGRALQNHQTVSLEENASDISNFLTSKCELHPGEIIQFHCTKCDVPACTHCLLLSHQGHSIICQSEKIKEAAPEIQDRIEQLADNLQRIIQTEKKLAKPLLLANKTQGSHEETEKIVARLTQHFTYLHGVLQNMENRFITKLQEQRNYIGRNINAIKEQIAEQKIDIENAILLATSALKSEDAIDVTAVIEKLDTVLNLPCHLVYHKSSDDKIELDIDESVVNYIEEHCTVTLPDIPHYSLARIEELPAGHVIEPVIREEPPPKPVIPAIKPPQPTLSRSSRSLSMLSLRSTAGDKENQNGSLVEGTSEAVKITHIKDPSCFYIQSLCASGILVQLQKALDKQAATSPIPTELVLNKMYLVQYGSDMKWYRGRVKTVYTDSKNCQVCDIFYVDYGNSEAAVPLKKMRNLSVQSSLVPIMAKQCTLHDIVPKYGQWEVEANKAMYEMIEGISHTIMHVFKVENNVYSVDITKNTVGDGDDTLSIRDALIFLEYGCCITSERLRKTNPQSLRQFFKEEIAVENSYDVRVTHIDSPESIYVQKIGDGMVHLTKLTEDMLREYSGVATNRGIIYTPQIGMPCAALYDDKKWYRGRISNLLGNQKVEVFFVDFGDKREYMYNEIRRLHYKFMSVTALAFKISLKDVAPLKNNEWGVGTKEFMVQNLEYKCLKIFVFSKESDSYKVTLYIPMENNDINFNALLAQEKLAVSTGSSSQFINIPKTVTKKRKKTVSKAKKSAKLARNIKKQDSDDEIDDSDPFLMEVKILQALSPDCIYIKDLQSSKVMKKLNEEIQDFYNKFKAAESEEWEKDDVCIAYSAKDKLYHRSKIVDIISPDEIVVFLHDISITETVKAEDLQSLHPKFATLPAQAVKIKLAGILPCGGSGTWLSSSCQMLKDLIDERQHSSFYISKAAGEENDAISVELWVRETRTEGPLTPTIVEINSINRKLVKEGVALPVRGYKHDSEKVLAVELRQQFLQTDLKDMPDEVLTEWVMKNESIPCPSVAPVSDTSVLGSSIEISEQDSQSENENANADADVESDEEFPLPPPLSAWIPPAPITDDKFCAISTNVDHDCVIYLHSQKQNGDTLALIDDTLQTHFNGSKPKACDMIWAPGDLCIAQYHADKKWYRAQVLELLENDEIKVIFVDYGNVDECKLGTLRKRVIMGHIPIQATRCIVYGLIPDRAGGKWTIPELDVIHALVVDKKSDVTVLERAQDHLVISMTLRPFHNINLLTYLLNELDFKIFGCIPRKQNQEKSQDTESECNSLDNADVVVGECIADYIPDRIEERMLFNLQPNTESNSTEKRKTLDCDKEMNSTVELSDDPVPAIDLDVGTPEISLNADSVVALSDEVECIESCDMESYEKLIDSCSSAPEDEEDDDDTLPFYTYIDIPDDVEIINLEPQHIVDPIVFHARIDKSSKVENLDIYETEFTLMTECMQSEAFNPGKLKDVRPNSPCCARYTADGQWYRGMIIEVDHDEGKAIVQYVDYGNSECLPIAKIHSLPETWLALPILSFKCRLWGIRVNPDKPSWKKQIDKFENVFYKGTVAAKIKDRSNGVLDVELYSDGNCNTLLYNFLLEDGLLEMIAE